MVGKLFSVFMFLCSVFNLYAQELPPVSVYTPEEYGAENQNWSISQSENKHVYIANNKGLLTFDGATWRLYNTPNNTILRSVKVIGDKVFTGFYNDFGFWEKNENDELVYQSLTDDLDLLVDEQFWHIEALEGWVVFQSLQRIYLYHLETKSYKVISSKTQFINLYKLGNSLYYQEANIGLFKLIKGVPVLISDLGKLKHNAVVGVHTIKDKLIIITDNKGVYYVDGHGLKVWSDGLNKGLSGKTFYSSIQVQNGDLVLGSIANGVFIIDQKGNIKNNINKLKGLSNNTVLTLFQDAEHNIWLGLDDGINVIDFDSPYSVYQDAKGVIGTIYTSKVYHGRIYIGTNQGLFYRSLHKGVDFELIKGTEGQVWCLKVLNDELFCGHNLGTFLITRDEATALGNIMGVWKIEKLNDHQFIQGTYSGLYVFEKTDQKWGLKNKIKGFKVSSRYFEFLGDTTIFVNHEYKGVYKLTVDKDLTQVSNVAILNNLSKGLHSALLKYKKDILYAFRDGVFKYQKKQNKFVKDTLLSAYSSSNKYISGVLAQTSKAAGLWGFTKNNVVSIKEGGLSVKPIITTIPVPLKLRKGARGFENIEELSNNKYFLGNTNGYTVVDLARIHQEQEHVVNITQVQNSSIESSLGVSVSKKGVFVNEFNNLKIYCSVPLFNKYKKIDFQYQLERNGKMKSVSDWTTINTIDYIDLQYGNYVLYVSAKVDGKKTNNVAVYTFKVNRPWYLSTPMFIAYFLFLIIVSFIIHTGYNKYYNIQKRKLLVKKQRELLVQKLENDKRLTLLENQKLEQDVTLKSKELASSTMSIVKKNELLNSIKEELLKGEQKGIKNVIKIIDQNLNNEDDWQLFQEAFNNADKDFIKKIKRTHSSLTSNDLRLCAYLRLNLSSKEIAPLLSISPKSVEVKRYRLRKKMNLSAKQNLSDYILSV